MADNHQLNVEILLPNKMLAKIPDAKQVNLPTIDGNIGILPNHSALICEIGTGNLNIQSPSSTKKDDYFISGGFVKIEDNKVTLITDVAEHYSEIDVNRAERAKDRAENRLSNKPASGHDKDDTDIVRAQASLLRALYRLKIAKK